jgi:copper homeostasis protein (lipoprotein)
VIPSHFIRFWLLALLAGCAQLGFATRTDLRTYRGILPCADCAGRQTTLTLFDDATYRMRMGDVGDQHAQPRFDLGRWRQHDHRIVLSAGWQFAQRPAGTLALLDSQGEPTDYTLVHARADSLPGPMPLSGLFVYEADAATLRLCGAGVIVPVLPEADYPALERAYLDAQLAPAAPLLVDVVARFVERAPEPGLPKREHLLVQRFGRIWLDRTCAADPDSN